MKPRHLFLQIFVCLAIGGLATIVIICFFIGFGFHSAVGKYALYTALFLQGLSLLANRITDRRYNNALLDYAPSIRMIRFRKIAVVLWTVGLTLQLSSVILLCFGMAITDPWVCHSCVCGVVLCPIGWFWILLASHRKRSAIRVLLARKNRQKVEV